MPANKNKKPDWVNKDRDEDDDDSPPKVPNLRPEDPQWICVSSIVLHWDLYFMLGEGQPTPAGGVGGWEIVSRPREVGITTWTGVEPERLSVPLMLDAWADPLDPPDAIRKKGPPEYFNDIKNKKKRKRYRKRWKRRRDRNHPTNVEQYTDMLRKLSTPDPRTDRPPILRLYGRALPHWLDGEQFVIEDLTWGARLHGNTGAHARRQAVTLELVEFIRGDHYKVQRQKKKKGKGKGGGGKGKGGKRYYVAKAGDNLFKIAAKYYGSRTKWKRIARANNLPGPRQVKPGDRLLIP
jgi:hypothetical protein